jgi:hypothetical protein
MPLSIIFEQSKGNSAFPDIRVNEHLWGNRQRRSSVLRTAFLDNMLAFMQGIADNHAMPKKPKAVSETLRQSIQECGQTRYRIAQETGIAESVLSRFVTGETRLSLNAVDTLCEYFQLELTKRRRVTSAGSESKGKT